MAYSKSTSLYIGPSPRERQVIIAAAKRIVASTKITVCANDSSLGFRGPKCPVNNCYFRSGETGACLASVPVETKAGSKITRDTMAIVDIINAARNTPEWVSDNTYPAKQVGVEYKAFLKEADIQAGQLEYVLDSNPAYSVTMQSVLKGQSSSL